MPYGAYKAKLLYRKADAVEGEDNFELKELPEGIDEKYFKASNEPSPVSELE